MTMAKAPDAATVHGDGARKNSIAQSIAEFDGSFAPNARPTAIRPFPWYRSREYFLGGWLDRQIWKAAFIEMVGTMCLVFISGHIAATLLSYGIVQVGAYIGLSSAFLITVFIYATAALTGGHLNPMITFSAIVSGLCPLSRGTFYLCSQALGSALAGGILLGVYGRERATQVQGGGCFYDPTTMSPPQVLLNEITASFVLLFLAYGVGLDPRQAVIFGPKLGPVLVGSSLGLVSFATSGIAPGYAGAQMHPARCFAYGIARRDMSSQWIWWVGPAIAALLLACIYNLVPPHPREQAEEEQSSAVVEPA